MHFKKFSRKKLLENKQMGNDFEKNIRNCSSIFAIAIGTEDPVTLVTPLSKCPSYKRGLPVTSSSCVVEV